MKRAITIFLALLMVLSLAACGSDSSTTNTSAASETENTPVETIETPTPSEKEAPTTPELTDEPQTSLFLTDVVGEYINIGLLMNENIKYQLNDDETFDQNADITSLTFKGLYTVSDDGFTLKANKSNVSETFIRHGDFFYNTEGGITYFDTDQEYGKTITLDTNGMTDQVFRTFYIDINRDSTGSSKYYVFTIDFNKDGSFLLNKYYQDTKGSTSNNESFEGTYTVDNDIMVLNYNDIEHILLIIDGRLYFDVIQKNVQ